MRRNWRTSRAENETPPPNNRSFSLFTLFFLSFLTSTALSVNALVCFSFLSLKITNKKKKKAEVKRKKEKKKRKATTNFRFGPFNVKM